MCFVALRRSPTKRVAGFLLKSDHFLVGKAREGLCSYATLSVLEKAENGGLNTSKILSMKSLPFLPEDSLFCNLEDAEGYSKDVGGGDRKGSGALSLAKSLACLPDDFTTSARQKDRSRMELKRLMELRIKKRVKAQYRDGKFSDLMYRVVANVETLQDAYDIIRLNSNVELASSSRDDLCFNTLAKQLETGDFDVGGNTVSISARSGKKECLVLPRLKLRVVQEAIRVVLEVVYRPHFSKISHGCRSGRSHQSALRYISKGIGKPYWWFTMNVDKEADSNVICKLISFMEEKIEDALLSSFIQRMFDARVLNFRFGGFPKGQGLPQEGVLSPVLMNIYLDALDSEIFRICMRYEGIGSNSGACKDRQCSKLRSWVRRQMNGFDDYIEHLNASGDVRLYVCRYMDEIFISISGSKDIALSVKEDITNYVKSSLYLDIEDMMDVSEANNNPRGLQFVGTVIRTSAKESVTLRAVHKLKDKIGLFAAQKQEIWDAWTLRIGKKWLAHGLKRIKESEIKKLNLSSPMLDHIAQFRKDGMKTDHWFKSLLKIWMQDMNAKVQQNEEVLLSNYIAEPTLPKDLREAFHDFQKKAKEYVSSETSATLALLPSSNSCTGSSSSVETITKMEAPIRFIKKSLHRYGLITSGGFSRHVSTLILQDDILIMSWFAGLVHRWLNWYSELDNIRDIKVMAVECVRKSCIRTLAAKHRMHEILIEKKFDLELNGIPSAEDLETETTAMASSSSSAECDESLMYGISYSGLCLLCLSRIKVPARKFNCFVMGCCVASPSMYTLHVKERQRFPGWKTGFSTAIHSSLHGRRIGLCNQHVKDLYLGHISLQSIEFGALNR